MDIQKFVEIFKTSDTQLESMIEMASKPGFDIGSIAGRMNLQQFLKNDREFKKAIYELVTSVVSTENKFKDYDGSSWKANIEKACDEKATKPGQETTEPKSDKEYVKEIVGELTAEVINKPLEPETVKGIEQLLDVGKDKRPKSHGMVDDSAISHIDRGYSNKKGN